MSASYFSKKIIRWHQENPRPLPWTGGLRNPYAIWLSEIIMQQTRIGQGADYYLRFIKAYPTVEALAAASSDDVMKQWQGLGYYTRARNLHKTAKIIADEHKGIFPADYTSLLALPGIGPYSAAAIASFGYGLAHAVVDGNVKRVIARFFGITDPVDSPPVHKQIHSIAQYALSGTDPAVFNQAIMNFGALICKPKPLCEICPVKQKCYAWQHDMTEILPVRIKKKESKIRFFHFVVLHYDGKVLLQQRSQKDIWHGLYAPPVLESGSSRMPAGRKIASLVSETIGHNHFVKLISSQPVTQQLTHQSLIARFHHITLTSRPLPSADDLVWVNKKTVHNIGKPRLIVQVMEEVFAPDNKTARKPAKL